MIMVNESTETKALITERKRCKATRKDGKPCTAFAVIGDYCVGHWPNSLEARRKGGFHSSKKYRLEAMLPLRLRPVLELLEKSINEVHEGTLKPSDATAIASLATATVRVLEVAILEQRLIELEERFGSGRLLRVRREEVTQIT